jgi:DNA-binding NarL/FixJ family response regulator
VRVAILEDQLLTREGLIRTLTAGGVDVVAAVHDPPALLRAVALDRVDAVTLDVRLPPTFTDEGLVVAHEVRRRYPRTAVIVLSQYSELEFVETLLQGDATSVGYLLKDRLLDPDSLLDAVKRVVRGECVIDTAIVSQLLHRRSGHDRLAQLTERELAVLEGIAQGRTNAGIARTLVISDRTVEVHVQHVFEKLELGDEPHSNRRVLAALAFLGTRD